MMKLTLKTALPIALICVIPTAQAATSDGKTWGVSAGWLHVMPQSEKQGVYGSTTEKTPLIPNTPASSLKLVLKYKMPTPQV